MVKILELLIHAPAHSAADSLAQLTTAAKALRGATGVRGVTVAAALPVPARADIVQLKVPSEIDAFVEIWADSSEHYRKAMDSAAGHTWRAVRAAAALSAKSLVLIERPQIPVPDPRPPTRNNAFLTRNPRFTLEQFRHEWHVGHGQMCLTIPYLKGFVPCDVVDVLQPMDLPQIATDAIEGVAQAYFDSPEDELAMIRTPQARQWFAHGAQTFGLIKAFGAHETLALLPA